MLIGQFSDHLRGVKNLFIVPDERLAALPFEALGTGKRFGDTLTIQLLDRATLLPLLRDAAKPERPSERGAVLISPLGGESVGRRVASLDSAGWKPKAILGQAAIPERLLGDALSEFDVVHIIASAAPTSSNLQFSPGKWPTRVNGEVSVADLASTPLRARVLVLEIQGPGGTLSSRAITDWARAALESGTEGVVLELWSHPPASSLRFYDAFYKAISDGQPAANAASTARSAVARDSRFRDPVHWAGYAYYGR
jgi:CHAT domain-containing protein